MVEAYRHVEDINTNNEKLLAKDTPVFVLAGGEGSRLKNTGIKDFMQWPKLLLDIPYKNEKYGITRSTMLDYTLIEVLRLGFECIYPLLSDNSELIQKHLDAFYGKDKVISANLFTQIGSSGEGTARAVINAIRLNSITKDCIITPADIVFNHDDMLDLLSFHIDHEAAITWVCMSNPPSTAQNIGKIDINSQGEIVYAREGMPGTCLSDSADKSVVASVTSGGVLVANARFLIEDFDDMSHKFKPPTNRPLDMWRDLMPHSIALGRKVIAYVTESQVHDLGELDRLRSVDSEYC